MYIYAYLSVLVCGLLPPSDNSIAVSKNKGNNYFLPPSRAEIKNARVYTYDPS